MDDTTLRRYELRTGIFKALAHPVRIYLLEKLKERPWCVCELATAAGIDKSVASKHLSQLRSVGLIDVKKKGTLVEYHLVAPCIIEMSVCAERTILENRKLQLEAISPKYFALPKKG